MEEISKFHSAGEGSSWFEKKVEKLSKNLVKTGLQLLIFPTVIHRKMYSKTTEDIDGSTDDLIPQRMPEDSFGYAQLRLGADEANSGHAPYSVVFSNNQEKARRKNYQIMITLLIILLVLVSIVFITLYVSETKKRREGSSTGKYCLTPGCIDAASFMQTAMDTSVSPCDNFYQFACGGWIKKNPIPEKLSRWGVDSVLATENLNVLRRVLEGGNQNLAHASKGFSAEQKACRFYKACMDTSNIKKAGSKPLHGVLKKIVDLIDHSSSKETKDVLREYLQQFNREYNVDALFKTFVEADARNSSKNIIQISQSGLFLSQTRYSANMTDKVLSKYLKYMTDIHMLLAAKGHSISRNETEKHMMRILNFEKEMSKIFVPRENMTEVDQTYHKMTIGNFQKECPMIDWLPFYQAVFKDISKITADTEIIVSALPYLKKLSNLVAKTPSQDLLLYMNWRIISAYVPYLSDEFRAAEKDLDIAIYGTFVQQERWKTCVRMTDSVIGFATGSLFVKKRFPGESKKKAGEIVEELRSAFINSLPNVDWMDDTTREAAKEKALAVFPKIGYPERIMNADKLNKIYEAVKFSDTDFFANILASNKWGRLKSLEALTKAVDKKMWYMTPATVNAYYDPTRNQIVFPAGILQPPYFDTRYPRAVNYGGIGAVIGHELLHGFDNNGRLFDKNGNSGKLWWTQKAVDGYQKKEKCFITEYGNYTVKGKHINGKVTLGENIADNGGLLAAYNAYKAWVRKNGDEPLLPGIKRSNDQMFFVSFGQSWCTSARTAATWEQLDTDTHSPAMDRVLGSISNSAEFAKAFNCPAGAKYNPRKKCKIW